LPAQFAEVVSIGFETELSGEHILSVTDFSINGDVYLIDHQTGNQVLLTESSTYVFTSEAGVFNDRFQLSFGYESIVSGLDDENNGIYSYSKNWITHVVLKDKTIDQANFRLLDLNGKVVRASFGKVTNSQWMVNTSGLKAGVYIVSVEAKGGVWKQKMVVN
ncbi:MAG: T9SS type A sorting domain-containing protein, partial [Marinoscillum sp.]